MLVGIVMAGPRASSASASVTTLSAFYFFYLLNALGYVLRRARCPNQVLLSGWFDAARAAQAMGIAYLGIGIGGALVPLVGPRAHPGAGLARRARGPRRRS